MIVYILEELFNGASDYEVIGYVEDEHIAERLVEEAGKGDNGYNILQYREINELE